MRSKQFTAFGLVLLLAATAKLASAATPESTKGAVVFGVDIDGYMPDKEGWKRELLLVLENKLKDENYTVVRMPPPTMCSDAGCMEQTVRSLGNEVGVYVSVTSENQHPPGFLITIKLYQKGAKFPYRAHETKCNACSEYKARDQLEVQFNKLLRTSNQESSKTTASSSSPSNGKKIGFYVMGAIGSALVVTGAVGLGLSLMNQNAVSCKTGQPAPLECAFFHDNTKAIAAFGTLLGIGAVLAPIGFILAAREGRAKAPVAILFSGQSLVLSGEF